MRKAIWKDRNDFGIFTYKRQRARVRVIPKNSEMVPMVPNAMKATKERFQFVIEADAEHGGTPAIIRVRKWLKEAIRQYGIRCTEGRRIDPAEQVDSMETSK